jgi:8-oxo-dGTP diphosphatase
MMPKVGVAVIVIKDSKILLGRRVNSHGSGTWQFPGGHLEFEESIEDCAKRELFEETNLKIRNIRFGPYTNDIFNEEQKHYITLFVVAFKICKSKNLI